MVPSKLTQRTHCKWPLLIAALLVLEGCKHPVKTFGDNEGFPDQLSEWNLFTGKLADLHPNERVVPYDLNTPLFSDYAAKRRFVWMPPGAAAVYNSQDVFEFPMGTVLAKTFSYDRLIETRLLVRTSSGWYGLPYVWNPEQTEAKLEMTPSPVRIAYQGQSFDYVIPSANQCKSCHDKSKVVTPLGLKARNLNRNGQLQHWEQLGYLRGAPPADRIPRAAVWNDPASGTLEARALAYLDVNCAHCHSPAGPANTAGLFLTYNQTDPLRLGFKKLPVAPPNESAGLLFDAVAGHPEQSILVRRMESLEPKVLMPDIGRSVVHKEGVALIREWIRSRGAGPS